MADFHLRLISLLGMLTALTVAGLILDYLGMLRRPVRWGLWTAAAGMMAGLILTIHAVLPNNHFYGEVFSGIKTDHKIVALTFDDGPYPPYTEQVLDILREYQVKATFFVIGQNAAKHPDLVRTIQEEGHQLGNHTWRHLDLLKADRKVIEEEIDRTARLVGQITGTVITAVRPPHGFRDQLVMDVMSERGLHVVEWSVMARDWTNPGVDEIVRRVVNNVENGSVVLLHDGDGTQQAASRAQTVEATRQIIRELKARDFRFVTVKELFREE